MNIWTIILAAGEGSRFGAPKALARWNGKTLLERACEAAPDQQKTLIVTGAHRESITQAARSVLTVHNPGWQAGLGTSIATGLAYAAGQNADMALIVPVDQPFITTAHLNDLAAQAVAEDRCILTDDGGTIGPPAAIPSRFFAQLDNLKTGGLKSSLTDFGSCVGPGVLADIDTREDLVYLERVGERTIENGPTRF